jgi:hypothetical protein
MASHTGGFPGAEVESPLFTQSTSRPPAPSAPSSGRTPEALGDDVKAVAWNHHGDILDSLVETDEDGVEKL